MVTSDSDGGSRMNCSLWRSIRKGYFLSMVRYCEAWGWKQFWKDTFPFVSDLICAVKTVFGVCWTPGCHNKAGEYASLCKECWDKVLRQSRLDRKDNLAQRLELAEDVCRELRAALTAKVAEADWSRIAPMLSAWMEWVPDEIRFTRPRDEPHRTNAGVKCDTLNGPCACGAWHSEYEKKKCTHRDQTGKFCPVHQNKCPCHGSIHPDEPCSCEPCLPAEE